MKGERAVEADGKRRMSPKAAGLSLWPQAEKVATGRTLKRQELDVKQLHFSLFSQSAQLLFPQ